MSDQLLEQLRVRAVLERYCRFLDDGNFVELRELFDPGCAFEMMGKTFVGRDKFAEVWGHDGPSGKRPTTQHALTNPVITVEGDYARAVSDWVMIDRSGDGATCRVALAGRYHDRLVRCPDLSWRFVEKRVVALGRPQPIAAAVQEQGLEPRPAKDGPQ